MLGLTVKTYVFVQNIWRYRRGVLQIDVVITDVFMLRLTVINCLLYKISYVTGDVAYKPMSL